MQSVLQKSGMTPNAFMESSADYTPVCQDLLIANSNGTRCVFGDITELVPPDQRKKMFQEIHETFRISKDDLRSARKSLGKTTGTADVLFTKAGRLKCSLGPVGKDFALVGLDDGHGGVKGLASTAQPKAMLKLTKMLDSTSDRTAFVNVIFSRRTECGQSVSGKTLK